MRIPSTLSESDGMCYRRLRRVAAASVFLTVLLFVVSMVHFEEVEDEPDFYDSPSGDAGYIRMGSRAIFPRPISTERLICNVPQSLLFTNPQYPHCAQKLQTLRENWKSHECYAESGVNGTECSFLSYLSTREHHCPSFGGSAENITVITKWPDLNSLFAEMNGSPKNYKFIQRRIRRMWPEWVEAREQLIAMRPDAARREKKSIFLYLGFLNSERGRETFADLSDKGGPLGELVQWSDLIASIHTLGHRMQIYTSWLQAKSALLTRMQNPSPCPPQDGHSNNAELIFTDIMGLIKIRRLLKTFYVENWCRFRVLDSFGTHAEFNQPQYFKDNYKKFGNKQKSNPWGGNALNLQQFLTLYPHTDDNTFLGFVVETHKVDEDVKRENITVVYGKEAYMWENSGRVLDVASRYTEIHATVDNYTNAVKYAGRNFTEHGVLSPQEFNALMRKAKVFLGLGFPLEGPAPLEAVANGAIFINPRFDPPKSRKTYKFFAEKPTMRKLTSQNPYMERFVGHPYVITVNIDDSEALDKAFQDALQLNPLPTLPYEYSFVGMLERVDVILTHLNFCTKSHQWPPFEGVAKIVVSQKGVSCQEECGSRGFLCERSFFKTINTNEWMQNLTNCSAPSKVAEPYAPYYSYEQSAECALQSDAYLFSCATEPPAHMQRLCPCRTFNRKQTILCGSC